MYSRSNQPNQLRIDDEDSHFEANSGQYELDLSVPDDPSHILVSLAAGGRQVNTDEPISLKEDSH